MSRFRQHTPGRQAVELPATTAAGSSWSDDLGTALEAGGHTAEQLGERGRAVPLQAAAALQHLSRFGLTALGGLLPDPDWRDAANLVGSIWDTYSAVGDLSVCCRPRRARAERRRPLGGAVQRAGRGAFDRAVRGPGATPRGAAVTASGTG